MKRILIASTWNVNECMDSGWNLTEGIKKQPVSSAMREKMEHIIAMVKASKSDLLCFQEFPLEIPKISSFAQMLQERTELKYFVGVPLNDSFLYDGGRSGIALFSKWEITQSQISYFGNPKLHKRAANGKDYYSFDKALLSAELTMPDRKLAVVTGHAISFTPFDVRAEDYPESYAPLLEAVARFHGRDLFVLGDFNTEHLMEILPGLEKYVRNILPGKTTRSGIMESSSHKEAQKLDYCMVSKGVELLRVQKQANFSDHLFCTCHCLLSD